MTNCPGFCFRAMRGASITNRLIPGARNCAWTILNTGAPQDKGGQFLRIDCVRDHMVEAVIRVTCGCVNDMPRLCNLAFQEPGADQLTPDLLVRAVSTANLAEVQGKLVERGIPAQNAWTATLTR